MKAFPMMLLVAAMLVLGGCGEKAAGGKTEAAAPAVTAKELTPEERFAEMKKKAEAGDAGAQFNLGLMYRKGDGVPKDATKAVEWYEKAATQNQADAQCDLGLMYSVGHGVPEDAVKAAEWYQKAAAQGNAEAQNSLSDIYLFGKGVPKDVIKSIEWRHKAAEQGNAFAQLFLGIAYYYGDQGVQKDLTKALEWYQKAAEHGNASAQVELAKIYRKGEGVPKDAAKAVEWYKKAAAQGHAEAQRDLGLMYFKGEGIPRNLELAYAWINLSAAEISYSSGKYGNVIKKALGQDEIDRARLRDQLEQLLTPAQRAEGQRLASNWKKGDILQASSGDASGSASSDGKPSKQGTGTAFAVSSAGHALTNHHVINGCTEVKVAGREGVAKVITSDSVNDLALLQLPGKTQDVASLNPEPGKLRQGEDIIVFGYPLEWALSSGGNLTPGIISALTGLGNNTNQIQITAPIQPGSSGSPVMDKKGDVVGVVSMKLSDSKMAKATGSVGQNVNFAVNGQTVRAFLDANQVPYKTGGGLFSREKSNADIAEEARKWTVLVECWK